MKRSALLILALAATFALQAETPNRHLLVVSGLGAEAHYSERFERWSGALFDLAVHRLGVKPHAVHYLAEAPEVAPGRIDAVSSKANVIDRIARIEARSAPGDLVLIVLIGHGTAQGTRVRFNLPGPDLAPDELAEALAGLTERTVVVVNAAPASGPFVESLSAPGRIIVAATASATENQHTYFGGAFADALADDAADTDKDGAVSVLEAFRFAQRAVALGYEQDGRLLTEHAILDDDADGSGSRNPDTEAGDGVLAARVTLVPPTTSANANSRERLRLDRVARGLVNRIAQMRRLKAGLEPREYRERLEAALVELAMNRRAARSASP